MFVLIVLKRIGEMGWGEEAFRGGWEWFETR